MKRGSIEWGTWTARCSPWRGDEEPSMRIYYDINLTDRTIAKRDVQGEDNVRAGRYFIAKTLLELGRRHRRPAVPGQSADLLGRARSPAPPSRTPTARASAARAR